MTEPMSVERLAQIKAEHHKSDHVGGLTGLPFCVSDAHVNSTYWPCETYQLTAEVQRLLGVEAERDKWLEHTLSARDERDRWLDRTLKARSERDEAQRERATYARKFVNARAGRDEKRGQVERVEAVCDLAEAEARHVVDDEVYVAVGLIRFAVADALAVPDQPTTEGA